MSRLLDADPDLAHRVELMSQDRVVLRTLGDELPPEGLDEAILAQLERAALLGLQNGEPGTASLPVSRVGHLPQHRRRRMPWLHRPAGAGLAAAALLVLSVGVLMQFLPSGPRPSPVGPIASGEVAADPAASAVSGAESARTAIAADVPKPPPETTLAAADTSADPAPARPGTEAVTGEIFTGDWDRALALLDEGRLLIRVRSASPEATLTRLEPLSARPARRRSLAGRARRHRTAGRRDAPEVRDSAARPGRPVHRRGERCPSPAGGAVARRGPIAARGDLPRGRAA
ncbi:MAG: hypothetical protein HND58_02275 [Planctomycetota bacterium]|nr:MAG: hypothetical protein HND58_02275 [Planctomycetota bacterium]